ncbi:MAG TPA: hypothetical protein VIH30_10110, partial [Aquirhabdus sp.]
MPFYGKLGRIRPVTQAYYQSEKLFFGKDLVGEIKDDQFLIVNSLGKVNGWVSANDVLGRITNISEPEPRPGVPIMLEELGTAYHVLIQLEQTPSDEAQRLLAIVDDLRWYANRIGTERWNRMPRSNKWSFEQNLWRLTK